MTLLDKLSRDNIHFHGVNLEDLSAHLSTNPNCELFPVSIAPHVLSFMNDNPDVVLDGHFMDNHDIQITVMSGRTTNYAQTAFFNETFHQWSSAFYMKGMTILAEFEATDGRQ